MNKLSKGEWGKMVAIVLIKPLTTPLTQLLGSLHPSATHVVYKSADSAVSLFYVDFSCSVSTVSGLKVCR